MATAEGTHRKLVQEQKERRLKLLANGYAPLPLSTGFPSDGQPDGTLIGKNGLLGSKAVTLKEWSKLHRDDPDYPQLIERWTMHGNTFEGQRIISATTGILTTPLVAAIDIDVDEEDTAWDILDALSLAGVPVDDTPIRHGSGEKLCLLVGVEPGLEPGKTASCTEASKAGSV